MVLPLHTNKALINGNGPVSHGCPNPALQNNEPRMVHRCSLLLLAGHVICICVVLFFSLEAHAALKLVCESSLYCCTWLIQLAVSTLVVSAPCSTLQYAVDVFAVTPAVN